MDIGYHEIYNSEGLVSRTPLYSDLTQAKVAQKKYCDEKIKEFLDTHFDATKQEQLSRLMHRVSLNQDSNKKMPTDVKIILTNYNEVIEELEILKSVLYASIDAQTNYDALVLTVPNFSSVLANVTVAFDYVDLVKKLKV